MGEKRKRGYLQKYWMYFVGVASIVFVIVASFYYIRYIRDCLMDQTIANVQIVTKQHQQAFDSFIRRDLERIHSYAGDFSSLDSEDVERIQDKLAVFFDVGAMYSVINLDTGEYYNSKSKEVTQLSEKGRNNLLGYSDTGVRESYIGIYTETQMFGYYERFTFKDGAKGMIQKGYESDRISEEFTLSFYNDQGFAYVVNADGDVLVRPFQTERDPIGQNIFDMYEGDEDCEEQIAELRVALNEDKTGTIVFHEEENAYIYTYIPLDNVDGWFLISIVPRTAVMDEANRIVSGSQTGIAVAVVLIAFLFTFVLFAWGAHRDLLEKELEKEYKEQQFRILANYLANNTDDAYIMLEENEKIVEYVSPNFERLWGISISPGEPLGDLKALAFTEDMLDGMKEDESLPPIEVERVNPKTGERKWFQETVYCTYIQDEKKYVFYISDRTENRKIQDSLKTALDSAKEANKAKSTFLSSVSHDIRTPMNAIIGLVTLLQQEADNPESVLEYTKRIDASSQYLLGLINDVLDMNKIESGKMMLNIGEVNLAELIERINSIIRPQVKAKEQTLIINTSCFRYEHLIGDKTRINQIFINILSNAVKYTPKGGRIEFTARELPQISKGFSHILFQIKDNGPGMSEEYQKVIFDPFTREQNSMVNEVQGTGLGMAITKNLVDIMGGRLSIESRLGEGSVFTVELNLRIQEKEEDSGFWEEHGIRRIIVVDDDRDVCENVVQVMSERGVTVDYVTDGEMVVSALCEAKERGEPYDLILLDWQMPKANGLEVAGLIRRDYKQKIPILLITAYDWTDIEEEAQEVGIDHFMSKPFFLSTFKEAIKRVTYKNSSEGAGLSKARDSIMKDKHILMVEDNKVNRFVLQKILTSCGATYDVAENGQEAVDLFEASEIEAYDFILMDVKMPVMDGYQATRVIRTGHHPCAETIPIIAMTANAFVEDVADALEAGMDAHVAKPIMLEVLEKTIKDVLDKKELLTNA